MKAEEKNRDMFGHVKIENSIRKHLMEIEEFKEHDQQLIDSMAKDCSRHFNRIFKGIKN